MLSFVKINHLVEDVKALYPNEEIKQIAVVFNTKHLRNSQYGRYVKPICLFVDIEGRKEKERVDNPEYYFNIPGSLDYIIDSVKEKYGAIQIDPMDPKVFKEDNLYYNRALAVIRNPKLIQEISEVEASGYSVSEFCF